MKTTNIIRLLTGLSFLIFFCPFFQMCSDDMMLKRYPLTKEQLDLRKQSLTANAYELSIFKNLNPYNDQETNWMDIFFSVIIVSSIFILIKSLNGQWTYLSLLCYVNMFLLIGFLITAFIGTLFENLSQIKFGYYLFLINTIAIIVLCKKAIKQNAI